MNAEDFRRDGFFVCGGVLTDADVERLRQAVADIPDGQEVRRRRNVYGIRNLLQICPEAARLAGEPRLRQLVTPILGERAFAVRAIFFDKIPGANWSLGWHQDNVIAVRERIEARGFVGWSRKAGVWQVQPPAEVLAKMIAVRVHLDDCGAQNGPLRVLPGSHRVGWIDEVEPWKQRVEEVTCTAGRGGVVVMRPLTLHASTRSVAAGHRRVIHLEFACDDLPYGLEWSIRVSGARTPGGDELRALRATG